MGLLHPQHHHRRVRPVDEGAGAENVAGPWRWEQFARDADFERAAAAEFAFQRHFAAGECSRTIDRPRPVPS